MPCEGECACCGDNVTQQLGTVQLVNELGNLQPGNKWMREGPEEEDDEPKWRKLCSLAPVNY